MMSGESVLNLWRELIFSYLNNHPEGVRWLMVMRPFLYI